MLTLRFLTLREVVDSFVVVACTRTHQGEPVDQEAIGQAYKQAFAAGDPARSVLRWVEPLMTLRRHGRLLERPDGERGPANTIWFQHIERQHRADVREAVLSVHPGWDETVMVSDCDEIPDPEIVPDLPALVGDLGDPFVLRQRFFSTRLGWSHPNGQWLGTTVSSVRNCYPQAARDHRSGLAQWPLIPTDGQPMTFAGSHLSWMGTDEERARKLDTFCHPELRGVFDPAAGRRDQMHSNGERLDDAPAEWVAALPLPIRDGSFSVPEAWR